MFLNILKVLKLLELSTNYVQYVQRNYAIQALSLEQNLVILKIYFYCFIKYKEPEAKDRSQQKEHQILPRRGFELRPSLKKSNPQPR